MCVATSASSPSFASSPSGRLNLRGPSRKSITSSIHSAWLFVCLIPHRTIFFSSFILTLYFFHPFSYIPILFFPSPNFFLSLPIPLHRLTPLVASFPIPPSSLSVPSVISFPLSLSRFKYFFFSSPLPRHCSLSNNTTTTLPYPSLYESKRNSSFPLFFSFFPFYILLLVLTRHTPLPPSLKKKT